MGIDTKTQTPPTPEDSPILMTRFMGWKVTDPIVQVWDPYGVRWRGLHTVRSGKPTKAWLEDKTTESKEITGWCRLRPEMSGTEVGGPDE